MHKVSVYLQEYKRSLLEDQRMTVDQLINSRLAWHKEVPAIRKVTHREIWNAMKTKEKNGATIKAFAFKNLYLRKGGLKEDPFLKGWREI